MRDETADAERWPHGVGFNEQEGMIVRNYLIRCL